MTDNIEAIFEEWVKADNVVYDLNEKIKELKMQVLRAETAAADAMIKVKDYMTHNGVLEDTVKGSLVDYKIYYTTPGTSISVPDVEIVPAEFVKTKKEADLKAIAKYLKEGNQPNWATTQTGEPKLTYKTITRR